MEITDEHLSGVRAILKEDEAEVERLFARFDREGGGDALGVVVTAAFWEAAVRRFRTTGARADVIEFVAKMRADLGAAAGDIDPRVAERLLLGMLGDPAVLAGLTEEDKSLQVPLLVELVRDEQLDEDEFEQFLASARARAEQLVATIRAT